MAGPDDLKVSKTIHLNKLVPSDYRMWVSTAEATLSIHGCLGIVQGTETQPTLITGSSTVSVASKKSIASWTLRHALAREALLKCLERSELIKVHTLQTAAEIWQRLHQEYGNVSDVLHAKAELKFHSLRKKPTTSIQQHIDDFTKLHEDVEYHSPPGTNPMSTAQVNLAFLRSLGEKFEIFQQAMGDRAYTINTGELFARVRAMVESRDDYEEEKENKPMTNAKALSLRISDDNGQGRGKGGFRGGKGKRGGFGRGRGDGGGFRGAGFRGSFRGGRFGRPNFNRFKSNFDGSKACTHCQRVGHTFEECRTRRKEQNPNYIQQPFNRNNGDVQYAPRPNFQANITRFVANSASTSPEINPYQWIVDSASNANLTPFRFRLQNYRPFPQIARVTGIGGNSVSALGSGSITLTDDTGHKHTIKNVLYVPDHDTPILSLMKIREQSLNFAFESNGEESADFSLSAQSTPFKLVGRAVDHVLYVTETPSNPQVYVAITRNQSRAQSWSSSRESQNSSRNEALPIKRQRAITPPPEPIIIRDSSEDLSATPPRRSSSPNRLHPLRCNPENLWHLRFAHAGKSTLSKHPIINSTFDSSNCRSCIRGKQHRNSFQAAKPSATEICERIHSDVCGPFTTSIGGSQYIVNFLDEISHYLFLYTAPNKSSATIKAIFENFVKLAENQSGKKVKIIRTDGGGEYLGDLTPFLESIGIVHETTAPYTAQSNGKAERINRTINESVRSMLYYANLPDSFWAEAATTAAHTWNRLPSNAIGDRIPFELWFRRPLYQDDIKSLRTFGCIVYAHYQSNDGLASSLIGQQEAVWLVITPLHPTNTGISNENASTPLTI